MLLFVDLPRLRRQIVVLSSEISKTGRSLSPATFSSVDAGGPGALSSAERATPDSNDNATNGPTNTVRPKIILL
jgi:hypothetical protein